MIVRGLVDKVIDKTNVRVQIPFIDRVPQSALNTSPELLSVAKVCTLPGYEMNLQQGDPVYIAFENNDTSKPVIIGVLSIMEDRLVRASIKVSSLECYTQASLPESTSIGEVTSNNIKQLVNITENIQNQLNALKEMIKKLK